MHKEFINGQAMIYNNCTTFCMKPRRFLWCQCRYYCMWSHTHTHTHIAVHTHTHVHKLQCRIRISTFFDMHTYNDKFAIYPWLFYRHSSLGVGKVKSLFFCWDTTRDYVVCPPYPPEWCYVCWWTERTTLLNSKRKARGFITLFL